MGRDVAVQVATLQLLIQQSAIFTAEEDRHPLSVGVLGNPLCATASILYRPGNAALPRTGADHKLAVSDRLVEGVYHARIFQHIACGCCAPRRLRCRVFDRCHQRQSGESHIFHGTRDTSDIAAMRGVDQNNVDVVRIHNVLALRRDG